MATPGVSHPASGLSQYRRALGVPAYRRVWLAAAVSRSGDAVNFVALPLYVFAATRSAPAVAALVLAEGVGLIAGGAAAQLVVDRLPPRPLLVGLDVARAVAALSLVLLPSFPTAIVVSLALALGTSVFSPLSNAIVPRLVDDDALDAANALQWTAGVVPQLFAAALGGLLVAAASARWAFGLNALSFLGSAAILTGIPRLAPASVGSTTPWRHLAETLHAARDVAVLPPLLLMQGIAALAVGASSALLVVLARDAYGLGPAGYGLWFAVIGAGALLGPLAARMISGLRPWQVVSGAYVLRGVGDVGLGLLRESVAGGALLAIYALNTSSGMVAYQVLVQRSVPAALRGRAFALLDVVWQSARLLSVAIGGVVAAAAGIRVVYVAGGALLVLAGTIGYTRLRAAA